MKKQKASILLFIATMAIVIAAIILAARTEMTALQLGAYDNLVFNDFGTTRDSTQLIFRDAKETKEAHLTITEVTTSQHSDYGPKPSCEDPTVRSTCNCWSWGAGYEWQLGMSATSCCQALGYSDTDPQAGGACAKVSSNPPPEKATLSLEGQEILEWNKGEALPKKSASIAGIINEKCSAAILQTWCSEHQESPSCEYCTPDCKPQECTMTISASTDNNNGIIQLKEDIDVIAEFRKCYGTACEPTAKTCPDGEEMACDNTCIEDTGSCTTCTPDCTAHTAEIPEYCLDNGYEDIISCMEFVNRMLLAKNMSLLDKIKIIEGLALDIEEKLKIIAALELNLEEQAKIINQLEVKKEEMADYIIKLELNIGEQAEFVAQLEENLAYKAYLVSQLQVENEKQAELVKQMRLSFAEQGEIINELNKTIRDDAEIIGKLSGKVEEQAEIIAGMKLNLEEQQALVKELKLTIQEEQKLIEALKEKITTQQRIIQSIEAKKIQAILAIIIFFIILFPLIIYLATRKRKR